jgi:putative ABC transport system permease protein
MMANPRATNRTMFWRIVRRLLGANRSRLFVLLLALGAGAAITAALLNLQVDAKRRLTTEFRAFGPNIVVAPRDTDLSSTSAVPTLDEALLEKIRAVTNPRQVAVIGSLYAITDVVSTRDASRKMPVVIVGHPDTAAQEVVEHAPPATNGLPFCNLGTKVAAQLGVNENDTLELRRDGMEETCSVLYVLAFGGQQDDQISVDLHTAQHLARSPGRLSLIQVVATGTPATIDQLVSTLATKFPEVQIRPIRQFTEAEGKIYKRISGLLTATVVLVLVLTALCVMAGMTNAAMERKNDVGLMKAIGGATRRVLRIFLAEAAVLGLIGGALGAAAGIALSIWLGQAVFGVAARPRLIVYPVAVVLTILVAIAGALPLRRLATVRPAAVLRGEG